MNKKIVLAYSGSLTTSVAIRWLADHYAANVVTVTLDLGAGGELQEIHERALAIGAARAHVLDVREEFADGYVLAALQSGALRGPGDALARLARPLIARKLVEIARIERATAVAHGCGASDPEMTALIRALDAEIEIIDGAAGPAPGEIVEYARRANIVVPSVASRRMTAATPDPGADVEIAFSGDVPVAISGVPMSLTELIDSLTIIARQHGIVGAGDFADSPAIVVLQTAFDARARGDAASVVRLKLQQGRVLGSQVQPVPGSELTPQ